MPQPPRPNPAADTLPCPICKTPVAPEGPAKPSTFPFCSDRCKLIDLGRWLGGKYQIPVEEPDESDAGPSR
jgi:endogenous inhibitor of DNA gyrase (YacG/DUF329 family)